MTIVQQKHHGRSLYYELCDPATGKITTWTPPTGLAKEKQIDALQIVVQRFEAETPPTLTKKPLSTTEIPQNISLYNFCYSVFLPRRSDLAEHTRASWETCIRLRICPVLGDYPVRDITSWQIIEFLRSLTQEGLSKGTSDKYFTVLQAIFKMVAEWQGDNYFNPMIKVQRVKPPKDDLQKPVDAHTEYELAQILVCLEKEPLKWRTLFCLLSETGLRIGEALAIKWQSVDFRGRQITVNAALAYTPAMGVYETTPKSRSARTVPISSSLALMLLDLYRETKNSKIQTKFVFHGKEGKPIHPTSPGWWYKKFLTRHELPYNSHPHKLRHSMASIALTHGSDVVSVSEILGHSSPDITLRVYSHSNEVSKKKVNDTIHSAVFTAIGNLNLAGSNATVAV